ncbi:hypothetical protein X943_000781 [Babesia divergens]|uniref:Uncharacterized protein n=1 Tax=Babesia divergens TaxID=32595 RepID=A0AAD9LGT8_BABDI|nr:hypothetical protein X943_000781 [Babesia divergens]
MTNLSGVVPTVIADVGSFVSRVTQSAKHGITDVNMWRNFSREIVDNVNAFDSRQAVELLGAFSYMRYRHRGALDALAARVYESCYKLTSTEISRVLRSYSMLEHRSDFMFRLMLPEISKRLDMFLMGDLTSVFYSYSNMGYYNRHLASCVEIAVMNNLHNIRPRDLCHLMCALGKLKVRRKRLETVLGCHFCKSIEICSYSEFALIVNALGRLEFCGHPHLFSVVETEIYRKSKYLPSQSFSLVANAVSRSSDSLKVVDFMAKEAAGRLREFDVQSLCLLSSAFSRRVDLRPELFDRMADRVGCMSLGLYPRALASLTFAYGRAGHLHGPLLHFAGIHLERFPEQYTCNEAAMVLRAHNLLNVRNESMLLTVARFICDTYPDLVPVEAVDLLQSERISSSMNYVPLSNNGNVNLDSGTSGCSTEGASGEEEEFTHINHLQVFSPDPFNTDSCGKNFLERGMMHSLLWIVQSFAQHGVWNEREVKGALQRIANEVACRPRELKPLTIANMLYAYSKLNYRLDTLLNLLIREIQDPRLNFVFEQEHLRIAFDALMTFQIDPSTVGVYRVPTLQLKRLMEVHSNDVERVVKAILRHEYTTVIDNEDEEYLEIKVPYSSGSYKDSGTTEESFTYVHVPLCVGSASGSGHSCGAYAEQLKYNFAI